MTKSKVMLDHCKEHGIPFVDIKPTSAMIPWDNSGKITDEEIEKFNKEIDLVRREARHRLTRCFKEVKPKQGEGDMRKLGKERYVTLKDRKRQPRVIICAFEYERKGWDRVDVAWGMAIRSNEDTNSYETGKRLAYARAVRAAKRRRPCFVSRPEAIKNVWSLCFEDFQKLMRLTAGMTSDFQKGDYGYHDNVGEFIKDLYHDQKNN
jgi:hypothetical protein